MPEDLKIEQMPLDALHPYAHNPRTHSKKQVQQIADSLKEFGWTNPILIDRSNGVIAGHGRLEAAKLLGMTRVPTLRLEHLSDAQKKAYVIADNKLAENAGWDIDLLTLELQGLDDLDFDLSLTGFEAPELDQLLLDPGEQVSEVSPEPDRDGPAVSREGDLWLIGPHRIICGDSLQLATWRSLMGGEQASMVFTDPPYNVPVQGHVSGLGSVKHREFAMASGEMSRDEFTTFLDQVFARCCENSLDGSIHYICMDWRHMGEVLAAGEMRYNQLKNLCVWAKTNAGMGSFYRSQHELVFVYKKGTAPHQNNFGLGETGRHRSNLWTYAGANTFRPGRMEDLSAHPTVKPLDMVMDAILDCSGRGEIVVDAFAGSGTTLVAAARTGRSGSGIELDPAYVDLIVRRLEQETGEEAVHADEILSFADLHDLRKEHL